MFLFNCGRLEKIQIQLGISTYEVFIYGAENCGLHGKITKERMEEDFGKYLKNGEFPYYVKSAIETLLADDWVSVAVIICLAMLNIVLAISPFIKLDKWDKITLLTIVIVVQLPFIYNYISAINADSVKLLHYLSNVKETN